VARSKTSPRSKCKQRRGCARSIVLAGEDAVAPDLDELLDAHPAPLGPPVDQARVEVLGHQRVLELLGEPIEHRGEHLDIDVLADLPARHAELDELERPVRILAAHEPVDRLAEAEPRVVAPDLPATV